MTKSLVSILFPLALLISSCGQTPPSQEANQPISAQADTCNDPDASINCCFINTPTSLTSTITIAAPNEPGERLIISGTVFKSDGKTPYPDVILYAYHTDATGLYSKSGNETGFQKWHGRLHGWGRTDNNGHYEIHSIRAARYPDNTMPAHIHSAVKTPEGEMYYINDFVFKDDSLVNEKYLSALRDAGGTGVVDVTKNAENTWTGARDIVLRSQNP